MNHSQMPIIPQRHDYLMTTTFIGVVLLQTTKRKERGGGGEGEGGQISCWTGKEGENKKADLNDEHLD